MRWCLFAIMSAALIGCRAYSLDVDGRIELRATEPIDVAPLIVEEIPTPKIAPLPVLPAPKLLPEFEKRVEPAGFTFQDGSNRGIVRAGGEKASETTGKDKKQKTLVDVLEMPKALQLYGGPDIVMPSANASPAEKEKAIREQFPPLPVLPTLPSAQPGPNGTAMTLTELQQFALRGNPSIRQAHLEVEAARGNALQVGLYPNPVIGYEGSTIGQSLNGARTGGQQGGYVEQTIKTGQKLELAREAAQRDVFIAEQKLKQTESDVQTQVRTSYFNVLSARKNFEVSRALAELTDNVFNVLLLQLHGGQVAAYEPMQIRVLAMQSRGLLVQSYNRYVASWKQLAAATGTPNLGLTELAGQIDMPVPHFEYDAVLDCVLRNHSSVVAAALGVERDRMLLRLAEAQPIPDVFLHATLSHDYTTPPFFTTANVLAGIPFPLFNRNQGGIQHARAVLQKSVQENFRVRNDLSGRLAEVFNRYENNRLMLDLYKKQMLPNQVQAFRAAVARHAALGGKDISYNDVVTAQQNLANLLGNYLGALSDQWTAVNDIGNLLQTKDLFQTRALDEVAPIPDVQEILREARPRQSHRESLSERLRLPASFGSPR